MTDQPTKPKTKYTLVENETGLRIEREGGLNVDVVVSALSLLVLPPLSSAPKPIGLYDLEELTSRVSFTFAAQMNFRTSGWRDDAAEMIGDALRQRLLRAMKHLRSLANPEAVELARLMYASVQGTCNAQYLDSFWDERYAGLRQDLKKYHACRLTCKALEANRADRDGEFHYLENCRNWRSLLSPGVPYKALNKTLDKLPVGISWRQILNLSVMKLEQPITKRLHLLFALCGSEHHNWGLHERTVLRADDAQIKAAALRHGYILPRMPRTQQIRSLVSRILDYPEPYGGDLVGLSVRSRDWHDAIEHYEEYGLPDDHKLPEPPVDTGYLEAYGIHFLDTAGAVYEEGRRMNHCVGTYASKAASGGCYLFHVDYRPAHAPEMVIPATIEVSPTGEILQASAPRYGHNEACSYGMRFLTEAFEKESDE